MTKLGGRTAGAGLAALLLAGAVTSFGSAPAAAVQVRYEAEQATIINGVVDSDHAGFTGTGYAN